MNLSTNGQVSAILCVRDGVTVIGEAIASLLAQAFQNFTLIIINDGSTDQTFTALNQFKDPRIIIQNIVPSGLTKALNHGLRLARGEFIARMDADDIALPERFKRQVEFLEKNPDVAAVGTAYEVLAEDGSKKPATVPLLESDVEIRRVLPKFNPFFHGSVMMRRSALLAAGGYDERFLLAQDYDLWFRLSRQGKLANINEVLMLRREGRQTLEKERRQNWYAIKARVKAIREGNSQLWNLLYVFRPLLVAIAPNWLKAITRTFLSVKRSTQTN